MAQVTHFKELKVYKQAFEAAMNIFDASKAWPREELHALTDKARRSSRCVCGSISEAWAQRRYADQFTMKLTDAEAGVAETQNWLAFAHACGYVSPADYQKLWNKYAEIARGLATMIANVDKWCSPTITRESLPEEVVDPDGYGEPVTAAPRKNVRSASRKPRGAGGDFDQG